MLLPIALLLATQAPTPIAHLHVHGVVFGVPLDWNVSGALVAVNSVPSPFKGYTLTTFYFSDRTPTSQIHTDEFSYDLTWGR